MKNTVLSAVHLRQGVKMGEFQGWSLPLQFGDLEDEYHAVRSAAGLFDIGFLGRIELSGPGAEPLLQKLFTRDILSLPDGQAVYGLFCNDQGGILDAAVVLKLPPAKTGTSFLVTTNAIATDEIVAWLSRHAAGSVAVTDKTAELAQIALQGPRSDAVLDGCTGARRRKLRQKQVREFEVLGIKAVVSRIGFTGERGYELIVPADRAEQLWSGLLSAGKERGLLPCGMNCRDILRMEAGYVLPGLDVTGTRSPLEAGLMMVVDLHKDFPGKDSLVAQKQHGPEKRLIGFELFDKGIPKTGATIFSENREIGTVTSASHSYHRRRDVGLGYVIARYALAGQEIEVEIKDREIAAKVVDLPFYRKK